VANPYVKQYLMTAGPTPLPPAVSQVMAEPMMYHRAPAFIEVYARVLRRLKDVFQTANEVQIFAASGTGALESAVANLVKPGEQVLVASCGKFGERWFELCEAYGADTIHWETEWGRRIEPAGLDEQLTANPGVELVFTTFSETSTGVVNDLRELTEVAHRHGALIAVDAISGIGAVPLPQDEWGVDVVVTGSQKGLMSPPGIASVSLAPWALDAIEGERGPRFYWDLRKARKNLPLGESAFTPAVSLIFAVGEALTMMREEGLTNVHARHRRLGAATRAGAQALGWTLFSKSPADSVTALEPPAGVDAGAVVKRLRDTHGITIAGGQDHMKGKMIRIGHMGAYDLSDIYVVLGALEECTKALGGKGTGAIEAARRAWETA